jgi:4'-phosphopantetheinyl transferase
MRLLPDEPHVWRVALNADPAGDESLSQPERDRAARFYSAAHRACYINAHVALRAILASYLDLAPGQLEFETNAYGKPRLLNDPRLEFNLAHSRSLALIAVTRSHPIGVDVEYLRDDFDTLELANRFFAPREIELVRSRPDRFFEIWTRKEAFIKAIGMGVSYPLQEFDVCRDRVELSSRVPLPRAEWFVTTFTPAPACIAALVTSSPQITLRHIEYHPK